MANWSPPWKVHRTVADIAIDNRLTLTLSDGYRVIIATEFSWADQLVDPARLSETGRHLLSELSDLPVGPVAFHTDGSLDVEIGGRPLVIRPSLRSEAWQLMAPDGSRAVCTPGGDIATIPAP